MVTVIYKDTIDGKIYSRDISDDTVAIRYIKILQNRGIKDILCEPPDMEIFINKEV